MASVVVLAPLTGWASSLDEVPDAVFSQRMLGDGLAIDPTVGEVRAPFDGVVTVLPASRHAVSLRHDQDVEVLIHVGLETVALKGLGFISHVAEGDRVRAGDLLISFDLDVVARGSASLMTPVIVTGEGWTLSDRVQDCAVAAGEPVLGVRLAAHAAVAPTSDERASRTVQSPLPHGLHARPAARVAAAAAAFAATTTLTAGDRTAMAASPISMMALGLKAGDELAVSASGPNAAAAVDAVVQLILSGMGETAVANTATPPDGGTATGPTRNGDGELVFAGVGAAPGMAIGKAVHLRLSDIAIDPAGGGLPAERAALDAALTEVRSRLEHRLSAISPHQRGVVSAHIAFLSDPALLGTADGVLADGGSAALAWRTACRKAAEMFRALPDPRMAERADDLLDVERQVLLVLMGGAEPDLPRLAAGDIVVAEDLLPSQMIALQEARVGGLCTARGGPTSHVAILAAGMGVPALAAVGDGLDQIADGALLVLDADGRTLTAYPSAATQAAFESRAAASRRRRSEARAAASEPCRTADGVRIEVFANLGGAAETAPAVANGAEGCGLLRTEFLFLDRLTAPDEEEQLSEYQAIADGLAGRPLIIRTLDAGGDKPLAYLPMPIEDNPALGLRGVRTGLLHPRILETQFRAVCRVASQGPVAVMLPMVASVDEVLEARILLNRAASATGASAPLLGVMIETPAAALTVDLLRPHIDFVSVGTNDLTQYALAMDRQNAHLASRLDALHPAVLRLIAATASGSGDLRWIGVCGALASDPLAAPLLVGLGVTELSAAPAMTAEVKAAVRAFTLQQCRALAAAALAAEGPAAVRRLATEAFDRHASLIGAKP